MTAEQVRHTVGRIVNAADPARVAEIYRDQYYSEDHQDGWGNVDSFERFRSILNASVGVDEGDGMRVVLKRVGGDKDDGPWIDVSGRDSEGTSWAIEFTPWGQWKLLPVLCEGFAPSNDEIAAHLYYEMTWFGWPENTVAKLDDLTDAVERICRDIAAQEDTP
ncbi:DUF6557 family protein [Sphingopyxis sp. JAI128]|uniref:DUF6557 family protein n=1 Tax=Sphingopyxis sp. JAI128 TaxID=2723066 RepID=UPI00161669DD|nr:DUF6557 family protein [Sphingopyxis sp. JAI128]MBB6424919.1 hypothetical protein [Sphingopyxis sp. JAI128]